MLFSPKVNMVESDGGFSVEVLGRTGIRYREGDKSLFVDSEVLAPGKGIAVFKGSIKAWEPPYSEEPISQPRIECIVRNIEEALKSFGQPVQIL